MRRVLMRREGGRGLRPRAVALAFLLIALTLTLPAPGARAQAPDLTIMSPADNAIIGNGSPVIVVFVVSDFELVQPGRVGQDNTSSTEGHVDVFVDGRYTRLVTRVEPVVLDLESGPHDILLQLRRNDNTALSPDETASISVIVTHGPATGTPDLRIVFPQTGYESGHDVYVAVVVSNFTLVEPRGRPNAPNEGHLEVLLGGAFQLETSRYEPAFIVDMPDGDNAITVRLVNNDATPLEPDVSASTTIHVSPSTATLPQILNFGVTVLLIYILIVLFQRRRKATARLAAGPEEKA